VTKDIMKKGEFFRMKVQYFHHIEKD